MSDAEQQIEDQKNFSPFYADDEDQFGLSWNIEGTFLLRKTRETDLFTLGIAVFLHV